MNVNYKKDFIQTVREYDGQPMQYGTYDCNLMVMKIYEPKLYVDLFQQYETIAEGVAVAKEKTGHGKLYNYIKESSDYVQVPNKFATTGDIGFVTHRHDVILHTGSALFGIIQDKFRSFGVEQLNELGVEYFRRV